MFVNVVTVEKDAEEVTTKEDYQVISARVSYRTKEGFQSVEKDGTQGKTYTQFIDATFFVRKNKEGKFPFEFKDLPKGTMLFVEGEIGQDVIPKKGSDKEKSYFTKLRVSTARLLGARPPKEGATQAPVAAAAAPAAKAERLEPRKPRDEGDQYEDFL